MTPLKKYSIISFISIVVLALLFFILIHLPQLFIQKNFQYKAFHIYSNTEIPLDKSVKTYLDSVQVSLEKSDFYNGQQEHHLYFVHNSFYEKMIRLIGRKNMAFAFQGNNQVYSAIPDFEKGIIHRNDNEIEIMAMVQVFTHEAVHNQMRLQYATLGIPTTPVWINEGYCEYVSYQVFSKQESYQLSSLIQKLESSTDSWIRTEFGHFSPRMYIRDRAVMEYLLDVKNMNIHEVIEDESLNPILIYEEMKGFYGI